MHGNSDGWQIVVGSLLGVAVAVVASGLWKELGVLLGNVDS